MAESASGGTNPPQSFWVLIVVGVLIRCAALNQPLIDAHLLRQCQTAAVTQDLMGQAGWPVAARIPWLGDLDARFILELPLYNYLTIGVHQLVGNLDVSGKLTSVLLWALSFGLLQRIWRRMLDADQTFWANLLFVCAPLEVFYGQAFMPEMLVQALGFGFLLLGLRYWEAATLARWWACAAVGLLGLIVKLPEVAHLYVLLGLCVISKLGWKAAFWPRHLLAAVLSGLCLKLWGGYVDSVNSITLPEWSGMATLRGFIGPLSLRFQLKPWATLAAYLGLFVMPGIAAFATLAGVWGVFRDGCDRLLKWWLVTIGVFYLLWFGNAGTAQSYYNLPAVAPICALFALGVTRFLRAERIARWRGVATTSTTLLVVVSAIPGLLYLFQQDRRIYAAALWLREHTAPQTVTIFQPGHRWDMLDYPYNPVVAYYSGRPNFIWTRTVPGAIRTLALERGRASVVTRPPPPPTGFLGKLSSLRSAARLSAPADVKWLAEAGFVVAAEQLEFTAYIRK